MNILLAVLLAGSALAEERKHTVVKGEHLWMLSKHYYSNPYKWRAIHNANTFIKDPHWIYPGQILTIPGLEVAAATPDEPFPPAAEAQPAAVAAGPVVVETPPAASEPPPQPMDSLSSALPENFPGQYPSMSRLKAPAGWKQDGEVLSLEGREIIAAQGDIVSAKVGGEPLKRGDKLYVVREDALKDDDADKKATYLVRVGVVEVRRSLGKSKYRLFILESGDSLQAGDSLSRSPL